MKMIFVLIGTLLLASSAALIFNKNENRWFHVLGGVSAMLGLIFATATPMQNGRSYRIENGRPVPIL